MDKERLKAQLRIDEDVRNRIYDDKTGKVVNILPTGGKVTGGVGFNFSDLTIPSNVIDELLDYSVNVAISDLRRAKPDYVMHSSIRQEVLANMCFNMGLPKLLKFRKMWAALEANPADYVTASDEMLDSAWAIQVGERARRLAAQMKNNR